MLPVEEIASRGDRIIDEVERAVVGKREALELVLTGFLADGHVLVEDFPGLAKTLIARSFAQVFAMDFGRVQFTPDLMPSDVTGSSVFNQRTGDFEFRPGPIFTNLLLGDEINRAPPKTQAALLEAMQERQVTIEGRTNSLVRPFLVIATQNPIEYEGTYPLPEAQLDRFILRIGIGYPTREDEWALLERRLERGVDEVKLDAVTDRLGLVEMQESIEQVHVSEPVGTYIVDIVSSTRTSQRVQVGASPRGSLAILKLARVKAALAGRDFVTPEDVKAVAVPALSHRLMLKPELWVQQVRPEDVVRESLESVPALEPVSAAEEQIFETRVELDAGPFSDVASLSAFERSLSHLPRVEDVYVSRLAGDRAPIELTLSEPSPLLQAMREKLPYSFEVHSASRAKIVLNVVARSPVETH